MEHQRTARKKTLQEMITRTPCTNKNRLVQGLIYIYHRKIGTVDEKKRIVHNNFMSMTLMDGGTPNDIWNG